MSEFDIQEALKKLPDQPGVYIMRDKTDKIIYIGKAVSLTKRVHQYFQASHDEGIKKRQMVDHIDHFEYVVTDSELEALVLECNLIKEHRPKYNTMLRDDKTYPFIKVSVNEAFPRVLFSRQMKKDGAKYFGPFTSASAVKDTIELVQKLYKIRTCNRKFPETIGKGRPCLNYHMKQCDGICIGAINEEDYRANVEAALRFLNGDFKPVVNQLTEKMMEASSKMEFERAAEYRDLLESVKMCVQKQKITSSDAMNEDIIGISQSGYDAVAEVFFVRNGRLIGREHFFIKAQQGDTMDELLEAFIQQFYAGTPYVPRDIYIQSTLENRELIEDYLSKRRQGPVHLYSPSRGQKKKLVDLAVKNAFLVISQDREKIKREEGRTIGAVKEIAKLLNLHDVNRLEAYDISNTSGYQSVGSMVVFEKGKPLRNDYRKFRLKTVEGPNDYASMYEVLTRRFRHGLEEMEEIKQGKSLETSSFVKFPDIIMMDGGRGQVNIALKVLKELKLDIPVCGMVKDDHHRTRGLYFNNEEIPIDRNSEGFKLITRLQDEAHRFAIEYHKSLRSKNQVHSFLDDINGIGPKRRKELMKVFASSEDMRNATVEDLMQVPSMNEKSAKAVFDYLHGLNTDRK